MLFLLRHGKYTAVMGLAHKFKTPFCRQISSDSFQLALFRLLHSMGVNKFAGFTGATFKVRCTCFCVSISGCDNYEISSSFSATHEY